MDCGHPSSLETSEGDRADFSDGKVNKGVSESKISVDLDMFKLLVQFGTALQLDPSLPTGK